MSTRKLGRGLESLMPEKDQEAEGKHRKIVEIDINKVKPNPNQPRRSFDNEKLKELAESIKVHGILQPIVVRKRENQYEIIAGERRWRASQMAGLEQVPVISLDKINEKKLLELSLIENIQREDLTSIEKAKGYKALVDEFSLTQEEVARQVGQNRATIANMLRLLELPYDIQESVSRGTLTMGHARALLSFDENSRRRALAARIVQEGLSVREVEKIVSGRLQRPNSGTKDEKPAAKPKPPYIVSLEEQLMRKMGSKVEIFRNGNKKGRITIEFADSSDFERIMEVIGITLES